MKDLTAVSSNVGVDDFGLGLLLATKQINRIICSYVGENALCEQQFSAGELELELTPRAPWLSASHPAGPQGPPSTPHGLWDPSSGRMRPHQVPQGQPHRHHESAQRGEGVSQGTLSFGARHHGGFCFGKRVGGRPHAGNVIFKGSARNFNVPMCKAAETSLVKVEEIVDVGSSAPKTSTFLTFM